LQDNGIISDINATSGILSQGFSTSTLITLRKSLTKPVANGLDPLAIVLHPGDCENR
jgi:hypothetical protein